MCYNKRNYRRGDKVIHHFRVHRKVLWSDTGFGWCSTWERAEIIDAPRNAETGRYSSGMGDDDTVKIKTENGEIKTVNLYQIEYDRDICDLSKDEFKILWKEICKGSMYYSDYKNSCGVFENTCMDYYEGYAMQCEEENEDESAEGFFWYCMSAA